jgi:hypothetical protein
MRAGLFYFSAKEESFEHSSQENWSNCVSALRCNALRGVAA